jgi:glycine cleavage system aminomethyltransferase T
MKFESDSFIMKGAFSTHEIFGTKLPFEFTGSQDEYLACRKTAWLGVMLNMSPVYDIFGIDVIKFMNKIFVNRDFAEFKDGASRHGIICNDKGQMLADGVIYKVKENHYRTYWLAPVLQYYVMTDNMDVKGEYVSDNDYFYQVDGPKSLEIMEEACQCDLHDLKFGHNKKVKICGTDMVIHRLGMSGALAYEVHGASSDAEVAYNRIKEVVLKFGGKLLGSRNYPVLNHTPAGYPNQCQHYLYPYFKSEKGLAEFYSKIGFSFKFAGSASDNENNFYVTPYDVGWGYLVNFEHEFMGKEALQKIAEDPPRKPVTLEWNTEDVGDVFMSQFRGRDVEPYDPIDTISCMDDASVTGKLFIDYILVDDKKIGIATGRAFAYYERRMISLAFIDKEYAVERKEVIVLWGSPGHPQKKIRAVVARFPYFTEEYRNETFNVEKIPHRKF